MGNWEMVRLGDAFPYIRNGASIKQEDNATGYPITRIETIADGSIDRNRMGYANINDIEQYSDFVLKTGDILMSHINSVKHLGKSALYAQQSNESIVHGMNLLNLRADSDVLNNIFAYRFLNSYYFKKQLPNITKNSVNQSSFNITALKELQIPLPPLSVQQKIANVLDRASTLIDKRKSQIDKLDLLVKSKFIEMFGDSVTNPKRWEIRPLSDITSSRLGKMLDSKQQTGKYSFPYLANYNVQWFRFELSELNKMDFSEADQKEFELKRGDLLICEGGEIGRCAIWNNDIQPCFFQKAIHRVRCDKEIILPEYLARWFYNRVQYNKFEDIIGQATIAHLPGIKLKQLRVPVPPLSIQIQFAAFVQQVEDQKFLLQKSLANLELNYKSLMQKCFRGEIF